MLDNLLDIEVAYSLIKETSDSDDPLDGYYKKLKTHIKVSFDFFYHFCLSPHPSRWHTSKGGGVIPLTIV